jgi:hypothetical protein
VTEAYVTVYELLDQVGFARTVPPGARGRLYSAIDGLRSKAAPAEHVALAERIAVALHRFEWALRNRDEAEIELVQRDLQIAGADWLQTPICVPLH